MITLSHLGLATVATESWLPAVRGRFSGMGVAAAGALREIPQRRRADALAPPSERPPRELG